MKYSPRTVQHPEALVARWGAPSLIKYAQSGQTVLNGATNVVTVTIPAVDLANTILMAGGPTSIAGNDFSEMARVEFADSTTLQIFRASTIGGPSTLGWCLLEFWPGLIRSIQTGNTTSDLTVKDQTISAVDPAKSLLLWRGYVAPIALSTAFQPTMFLQSPTNIRFTCGFGSGLTTYWQVVEFF